MSTSLRIATITKVENNWLAKIVDQDGRYFCTISFNKSVPQDRVRYVAWSMIQAARV